MLRKILFYFLILFFTITFLGKNPTYAAVACTTILSSPSPLKEGEQHFNIQTRFDSSNGQSKFKTREYFITIGGSAAPYDDGATTQRPANAAFISTGYVSTTEEFNLSDGWRWGGDKKLKIGNLRIYVWRKNPDKLICEGVIPVLDDMPIEKATAKSCPVCQDGYAWSNAYNLCQDGADFKDPLSRTDCSAQGSACLAGEGRCVTPKPEAPKGCFTRSQLGESCTDSLGDPGQCADGLICDVNTCTKAPSDFGSVCYNCASGSTWDGSKCVNSSKACIEPDLRAYCPGQSTCTQGEGCQGSINPKEKDKTKLEPLNTPCGTSLGGDGSKVNECLSISSALGDIPTDPFKLVPKIIEIILGISGAIVIILIIRAGYKLMFSQGNPEKVQEAREELTSAIVGLLFIIFSFVLLQFLLNDLLKIQDLPGGIGIEKK